MPIFIAALWGGFVTILGSIVGRVLLSLGVSFIAYKGFDVLFSNISNMIKTSIGGATSDVLGLLGYFWVDKAISIILSAYSLKLAYTLTTGVLKKAVLK